MESAPLMHRRMTEDDWRKARIRAAEAMLKAFGEANGMEIVPTWEDGVFHVTVDKEAQ